MQIKEPANRAHWQILNAVRKLRSLESSLIYCEGSIMIRLTILHAVMSESIGERHASACRYKKRGIGGLTPLRSPDSFPAIAGVEKGVWNFGGIRIHCENLMPESSRHLFQPIRDSRIKLFLFHDHLSPALQGSRLKVVLCEP